MAIIPAFLRRFAHFLASLVLLTVGLNPGTVLAQTKSEPRQAQPNKKATKAQEKERERLEARIRELRIKSDLAAAISLAKRRAELIRQSTGEGALEHLDALKDLGDILADAGRHDEVRKTLGVGLAAFEKRHGHGADMNRSDWVVADVHMLLAKSSAELGNSKDAEKHYLQAIRTGERSIFWAGIHLDDAVTALGKLYHVEQRWAEAAEQLARAVALREDAYQKRPGLWHDDISEVLDLLGNALKEQFQWAAAEAALRRALAIRTRHLAASSLLVAQGQHDLAEVLEELGKLREAEDLHRKALAIREERLGAAHADVALSLKMLSSISFRERRWAEYEEITRRALETWEKAKGLETLTGAALINNLALVLDDLDRLSEAEALHWRALAIREKLAGPNSTHAAETLANLAVLLSGLDRYEEAERLLRRCLAIREKAHGQDHPEVAYVLDNLATVVRLRERYEEAVGLRRRALAIREKLGPEHADTSITLNNLGIDLEKLEKYDDAIPNYRRSVEIKEKIFGPDHREIAATLANLGVVYGLKNRAEEAEASLQRALAIFGKTEGEETRDFLLVLSHLIDLFQKHERWREAMASAERYFRIHRDRVRHAIAAAKPGGARREQEGASLDQHRFYKLVRIAYNAHRAALVDPEHARNLAFEMAQLAEGSRAAIALSQMSARSSANDAGLAAVLREQQDLREAWSAARNEQVQRLGGVDTAKNNEAAAALRERFATLDARLEAVEQRLQKDFPNYVALTSPIPITVEEARALLVENEALVSFLDTSEGTLVWVVTRTDARWLRSGLDADAVKDLVFALRCGLDNTAWFGESALKCQEMLRSDFAYADYELYVNSGRKAGKPLPFDVGRAHQLYRELLGGIEDLIRDRRLLIVPTGPLTALPFNVLVTELPKTAVPSNVAEYRGVAWLGARQPITVLPSVASLKTLREHAKTSRATRPYLGIANPLLDGPQRDSQWEAYWRDQAKAAQEKTCSKQPTRKQSPASVPSPGLRNFGTLFRGQHADVSKVRAWTPLPETADEVCEVGGRLGATTSDIYIGAGATEGNLKDLSENGQLAQYGIVHFATHGALSGQVKGAEEPGLILTPPRGETDEKKLERDDGFLTASEIATLKLDADWVILSACNTAAGTTQDEGGEALSGMARAFFYAGARALLVSHWAVDSDAAVDLTTRAFEKLKEDPAIGRAEAFRISMREMIEKGAPHGAHPEIWAPFVLVGEGAR